VNEQLIAMTTLADTASPQVTSARRDALRRALFHGDKLTLDNPQYLRTLEAIAGTLLAEDREPHDMTVSALGLAHRASSAGIVARTIAKEDGVAAGLQEGQWLVKQAGARAALLKHDGDLLRAGDALLEIQGTSTQLLSLERVCLNILQRMCGIASTTRLWQASASCCSPSAFVVATRKTPWGLLDKRAVHCGGGGTHRLGLGDAILIKNNHLALLHDRESDAVPQALEAVWPRRAGAAFIEVEVRSPEAARIAAITFQRLQAEGDSPPCLILLDNMTPDETGRVVDDLRAHGLWEHVLLEASGKIGGEAIRAYAASGVDAISAGALTHSVRALDLNQKIVAPEVFLHK
jgi:nicotinate-nucleotide pyrophosphorylase (carboxylating)